jgi:hypothetical protein
MAVCNRCGGEMRLGISCTTDPICVDGELYPPIRFGDEWWEETTIPVDTCGDCGVRLGGVHHVGCDQERCPACGEQALSCECHDEHEGRDRKRCGSHLLRGG